MIISKIYYTGGGTGDPHIRTIDGKAYTFNGHGEYSLISATGFEFQARMEPYLNAKNETIGATIFTAFAARDYLNDVDFMIKLNYDRTG